MAESSHPEDRSARVDECVKCAACSRRFEDPRLLSCHHTFCKACLRCSVISDTVRCPKCRAVLNLSADGLEGLPSSPVIIHLLKVVYALERIQCSLAIWESQRDRNPQNRTPPFVMVTPSRTDSNGDVILVTPSMTERSALVEENVECAACSRRFEDPRLLSCHHTFCKACLQCSVINDNVTCPKCRAVLNLSADGLEGLPSSPTIIHLLKVANAQESMDSLAIRERHARGRNPQHVTPPFVMVTPSRTDSNGDVILVTPSMTERSALVEENVECAACSRRFEDPRLLSCHHTFCKACLRCSVISDTVRCPKCRAVLNLSADGLEGLPSSPVIIHLLKVVYALERIQCSLAIWESQRDRNPQYRTPPFVMVTPSRTDSNGDVILVTPSMTERSPLVEDNVECAACSRRFEDPRLLSCHHTFCKACLQCSVINDNVTCPKCRAVLNLSADGLEGLPSSPTIIHLLKVTNAQESMDSLAIRERHARGRNPQHVTHDIAMVTPPRTDSDDRHGDIAMVTPSMPGYAERRGTVFLDHDMFLGGSPGCIAVSPAADRLYVTIYNHRTVLIFDDRGKLMKTAYGPDVSPGASSRGGEEGFNRPSGIAVNKDGDVIVSDTYNHRVVVLNRDGEYKFSFGTHGVDDGQFDRPWGMAVDDTCKIYVCDWRNRRVQVFTRDGKYLRTFEIPCNLSVGLNPRYLAIVRNTGRIYVTYWDYFSVYVYTPLGRWIANVGNGGRGEGELYFPRGICVDDDGRVIIADYGNHRVQVFNGDGTYHCTLGAAHDTPRLSWPDDLTIDKNGRVFVVDSGNKRVLVF